MKTRVKTISFLMFILFVGSILNAGEIYDYYYLSFSKINEIKDLLPKFKEEKKTNEYRQNQIRLRKIKNYIRPYARGNNREEIYIRNNRDWTSNPLKMNSNKLYLAIKIKKGKKPSGFIFFINQNLKKMNKIKFKILNFDSDQNNTKKMFFQAKETYYQELLKMRIPGAAWFRYNINQAKYILSGLKKPSTNKYSRRRNQLPRRVNRSKLQETYSLFSGGRALSENLQLDRTLSIVSPKEPTILINSIKGITTTEFNWKDLIKNINPNKDRLSRYIPFDQYAVFFKTFNSMIDLIDEMEIRGTPILKQLEPRSEDMYSKKKYQIQLCLPTNILSRLFGSSVINGIAITGSDPYLRTGTDLSILFDSKNTNLLKENILFHYKNSMKKYTNCKKKKGDILGLKFIGVKTPDRKVSSYMVILDKKTVLVSNSLKQLSRIIKSIKGEIKSLHFSDEYTYFRQRYKKKYLSESALIVISDAFIRKICSPKWRIADSRRTRAAAVLSELRAEYINSIYKNIKLKKEWLIEKNIPGMGKLKLTKNSIFSTIYGSLEYLTPISELVIQKVTKSEKKAYERFRNNYQNNWRKYFDPIAIRIYLDNKKVGIDMTVKPLIKQSKYRGLMEIMKNSAIKKYSGDIHPESLVHYIMSLDPESDTMKKFGNFTSGFAPALGQSVFNWIGNWVSFYVDDSTFWKDLKNIEKKNEKKTSEFFRKNIFRFPAAIAIEVKNALKLTLFLSSLRAYINQTAPGLTNWEVKKYKGHSYICVSEKKGISYATKDKFKIYYAATPKLLIFSLSEKIIKRSLNRINSKTAFRKKGKINPWLGKSFGLKLNNSFLDIINILYKVNIKQTYEIKSWANIFILNEWKKLNDKISPQLFHSIFWKSNLICPGGGEYIWNDNYQTMVSTVFGFPGQSTVEIKFDDPLKAIDSLEFGITFEGDGLRARAELVRKSK